jgi:hypothetical protein
MPALPAEGCAITLWALLGVLSRAAATILPDEITSVAHAGEAAFGLLLLETGPIYHPTTDEIGDTRLPSHERQCAKVRQAWRDQKGH